MHVAKCPNSHCTAIFSGVQQGPKNYRSMIVSDNDNDNDDDDDDNDNDNDNDKITYITTRKLLQLKWKYVNDTTESEIKATNDEECGTICCGPS